MRHTTQICCQDQPLYPHLSLSTHTNDTRPTSGGTYIIIIISCIIIVSSIISITIITIIIITNIVTITITIISSNNNTNKYS